MPANPLGLLLIDDDEDAFLITRALLSQVQTASYSLEWAKNYDAGLSALRRGGFDACLLDYRLGARDGLELLRQAIADGCRVPVIMLTGQGDFEVDQQAMKVGAADYLVKNALDGERLDRSIRFALKRQRLLDALAQQAEDLKVKGAELEQLQKLQVQLLSRSLGDRLAELEAVLDIAPVCIWIAHDPDCRRVTGNRFTNELFQVLKGTNLSRTAPAEERCAYRICRDGKEIPLEELPLRFAAARGVPVRHTEMDLIFGDGRIANLIECAVPLFAADGKVRGAIAAAWDITPIKQADEQKRVLEAKMQHAQRLESLGVLAGGIAHDFNNLLTGILGYADLALLELSSASPIRDYVQQLVTGAQRAAELTTQMLAYSGKGGFVFQPLHLSHLVKEMSHLLQVSISKRCILKHNLAPDLPAIDGDGAQLRQIIMNLIVNASEAIGDRSGVIAIRTSLMNCSRDFLSATFLDANLPEGPYVALKVSDTGGGMTRETAARVFDPFFTTKATGRGLGLAAVMGIIRSHLGAIKIDTQLGRGTIFTVLFPPSKKRDVPVAAPAADMDRSLPGGTILIIDDEEAVRGMAKIMVQRMGYSALLAADGLKGIEALRVHGAQISAVLLDMTMPHMNGVETFLELRRIRSDVRIVLSSGYSEDSVTSQLGRDDLAGFLQKPYKYEALEKFLREAVYGTRGP